MKTRHAYFTNLFLFLLLCWQIALATAYDLFAIAGQSNATGIGNIAQGPHTIAGSPLMCVEDGSGNVSLVPLADPVQEIASQPLNLNHGSAWPEFANTYYRLTGHQVIICGGAVNSQGLIYNTTGFHSWTQDTFNIDALAGKVAGAQAVLTPGDTIKVAGLIWVGGEQDAAKEATQQQWHDAMVGFLATARTKLATPALPIYIVSLDNWSRSSPEYAVVRAAQSQVASDTPGVYLVVPYQGFEAMGWTLPNSPHWNQSAQNVAGALAAAGITRVTSPRSIGLMGVGR